jgi:hypothetical protein
LGGALQEMEMKFRWIMTSGTAFVVAFGVIAANPALARAKHKAHSQCAPQPHDTSTLGWLFNPAPQPNGCAPPVYAYGKYVGQDPDPFIRQQLNRDPQTGYSPF